MKTIYLSGPITGRLRREYMADFACHAVLWKSRGYRVRNPAAFFKPGWTWVRYMRRDLAMLVKCDAIAMLQDWRESRGARLEVHVAMVLKMPVYDSASGHFINE